jgi:FlaA1/EpsC-like NDP-sugar epimerase
MGRLRAQTVAVLTNTVWETFASCRHNHRERVLRRLKIPVFAPDKDVQIEITQLYPGEKLSEILVDDTTETLCPTSFAKIGIISSEPFDVPFEWLDVARAGA